MWQAYLVPRGDTVDDVVLQVRQGQVVRETKEVRVKGEGWRSRTWTPVRLGKPGDWSITLLRGEQVLATLDVRVF